MLGLNKYMIGGIGLFIVLSLGAGWYLVERNGTLKGQRDLAKEATATAVKANQDLESKLKEERSRIKSTEAKYREARDEAEKYKLKFAKHDLETLAKAKPRLITRIMQRGTTSVLDDLETAINGYDMSDPTHDRPSDLVAPPATSANSGGGSMGSVLDQTLRESLNEPPDVSEGD